MANVAALFRDYAHLEKKRTGDGLTPVEFQRWRDLKDRLNRRLSPGLPGAQDDRRDSVRVDTKLKISFKTADQFEKARMLNISRGGIFVNTPFPPEIGTRLLLRIRITETGTEIEVPGEVVSANFTGDSSTANLGMGIKFLNVDANTQKALEAFYGEELQHHADEDD